MYKRRKLLKGKYRIFFSKLNSHCIKHLKHGVTFCSYHMLTSLNVDAIWSTLSWATTSRKQPADLTFWVVASQFQALGGWGPVKKEKQKNKKKKKKESERNDKEGLRRGPSPPSFFLSLALFYARPQPPRAWVRLGSRLRELPLYSDHWDLELEGNWSAEERETLMERVGIGTNKQIQKQTNK